MANQIHLSEQLVELQAQYETDEEVISHLFQKLYENECVKETYLQAVLKREEIYPTGLPLEKTGVAIPHADSEHVQKAAIAISVLKSPIMFGMMGSPETKVEVKMVLMLAISDPAKQLTVLQRLMEVFQNEQTMKQLTEAKTKETIVQLLQNELNTVEVIQK